jgi:phosphatidate cytidylyltransferase
VGLGWLDVARAWDAPSGAWLFPLAVLFGLLASGEMISLLAGAGLPLQKWIVYVGNLFVIASNVVPLFRPTLADWLLGPLGFPLVALVLAFLIALAIEVLTYREKGRSIPRVAATALSLVYVGILMSFAVQLAIVSAPSRLVPLISLVIVVKMADTGAYTVGRLIGRHKMTPRLSPGKTWEGAIGAVVLAVIGSAISFLLLASPLNSTMPQPEAWRWIFYAVLIAIAGMFGDLAESLFKREAGVKNSSTWMPGLGGVLDVLDSILFAAPVAYACWAFGLLN